MISIVLSHHSNITLPQISHGNVSPRYWTARGKFWNLIHQSCAITLRHKNCSDSLAKTNIHAQKTSEIKVFTKHSLKSIKYWPEQNNNWIPMKQTVLASFICGATKSEQLLQTELHQDKWNQILTNHHQNPENTDWREKIHWIRMKQKNCAPFISGAINSKQLLQTELHPDTWKQEGTKTLNKI